MPYEPVVVTVFNSPSTHTLDFVFHCAINYVESSTPVVQTDLHPSAQMPNVQHYETTFKVKVAREAILYHYKDSVSEDAFIGELSKQIVGALRGKILAYDLYLPKDVLDLFLAHAKSILYIDLANWLNKYNCGWKNFIESNIPHNLGYKSYASVLSTPPLYPGSSSSTSRQLEQLSKSLPGIKEKVKYPCQKVTRKGSGLQETIEVINCPTGGHAEIGVLHSVIMHLNDAVGWSREQIADWIETLDVDTTFKSEPIEVKAKSAPSPDPYDMLQQVYDQYFKNEIATANLYMEEKLKLQKAMEATLVQDWNFVLKPAPKPEPAPEIDMLDAIKNAMKTMGVVLPTDQQLNITVNSDKIKNLKGWKDNEQDH